MKASQIIAAITAATAYLKSINRIMSPNPDIDVTDFGLRDFDSVGLVAVVLMNFPQYCSKWLVLTDGQVCPNHYHPAKMETITCENGVIKMTLYGTAPDDVKRFDQRLRRLHYFRGKDRVSTTDVSEKGVILTLNAGEGVTLMPGVWHEFQAVGAPAFAVEVSTKNNDYDDNVFAIPEIGRHIQQVVQDAPDKVVRLNARGFIEVLDVA